MYLYHLVSLIYLRSLTDLSYPVQINLAVLVGGRFRHLFHYFRLSSWQNFSSWKPFSSWQPFWKYPKGKGKYGKQYEVDQRSAKENMNFGDLPASAEQQYEENGEWTLMCPNECPGLP